MTTLITGGAGFIGSRLALRLLEQGDRVIILDNLDPYYDPAVKRAALASIRRVAEDSGRPSDAVIIEGDVRDAEAVEALFDAYPIRRVAHMAAMSGVSYSAERAPLYTAVNVTGAAHVLEAARRHAVELVVMASTSNVYGDTSRVPFREDDPAVTPLSPYPASKRAAELLAHSIHHLHGLNITALRFFNVYGPGGRPDMMPLRAIRLMLSGQPIPVYGGGGLQRDWTYIDDILSGLMAALERPLGFRIINLGSGEPISLTAFLDLYEQIIGKTAIRHETPVPATEMPITYADNRLARELLGFAPTMKLDEGLRRTWAWYQANVLK
ncbi:MAG: GDP-mannose 4,6-dehydratase [Anaerolineae bacterium]